MDRQDAKPSRPSLLADDTPRSSAPAPSASRILADMESRTPATPGVRKPRARRRRGAGVWIALGLVSVAVLAGGAWWLLPPGDAEATDVALATTPSVPSPAESMLGEAASAPLPAPSSDLDHARVLPAPPADPLTGTADVVPRASAPAQILEAEADNPFAVIDKSATKPAAVAPAPAKATPVADPFAVVAKATPAPQATASGRSDDNPFAKALTPAAPPTPAAKAVATAKPKPAPASPRSTQAAEATAKISTQAAASATAPGTDLLSHLNRSIQSANQGEPPPPANSAPKAISSEHVPPAKPLQRKTTGTDAEVVDDLVDQINKGNETVVKPLETVTSHSASELLKRD